MSQEPRRYTDTDEFVDARFVESDFRGSTFRECDLRGARIVGSIVDGLDIWSFAGEVGSLRFEGVDVTDYVQAELDRRHPDRVAVRNLRTADDHRSTWTMLRGLWDDLDARADRLPEAALHRRVDDEWSLVETKRHLVFATDLWVGRMVRQDTGAFHPLGLTPGDSSAEAELVGLTPGARPTWSEIVALHRERMDEMTEALADLTDDDLAVDLTAVPFPAWGEETHSVGNCLRIVAREHSEHLRYALRDLEVVTAPGRVDTTS